MILAIFQLWEWGFPTRGSNCLLPILLLKWSKSFKQNSYRAPTLAWLSDHCWSGMGVTATVPCIMQWVLLLSCDNLLKFDWYCQISGSRSNSLNSWNMSGHFSYSLGMRLVGEVILTVVLPDVKMLEKLSWDVLHYLGRINLCVLREAVALSALGVWIWMSTSLTSQAFEHSHPFKRSHGSHSQSVSCSVGITSSCSLLVFLFSISLTSLHLISLCCPIVATTVLKAAVKLTEVKF